MANGGSESLETRISRGAFVLAIGAIGWLIVDARIHTDRGIDDVKVAQHDLSGKQDTVSAQVSGVSSDMRVLQIKTDQNTASIQQIQKKVFHQ